MNAIHTSKRDGFESTTRVEISRTNPDDDTATTRSGMSNMCRVCIVHHSRLEEDVAHALQDPMFRDNLRVDHILRANADEFSHVQG